MQATMAKKKFSKKTKERRIKQNSSFVTEYPQVLVHPKQNVSLYRNWRQNTVKNVVLLKHFIFSIRSNTENIKKKKIK